MFSSLITRTQEASMIRPCQKFEGHSNFLEGIIHLLGRQWMMTCSRDGSLRVWNLKSGKQIGEDWQDGDSGVWTLIALSLDGKEVVSRSLDGAVRLWDIDTGKVIAKWTGHTQPVKSVCWSRDGQQVVSRSEDGTAREWDVENRETIVGPIETGHEDVFIVIYSPDMIMFVTSGYDSWPNHGNTECAVKIWNAKTGVLVATLKGHTDLVVCLAWTPNGKTLISGSVDSSIRTWNTSNQIAVLDGHTESVYGIAISPNGHVLTSASRDKTARLWNLNDNQPISSPLNYANTITVMSFSADGKLLATCCDDKSMYTWDVSAILEEAGLDDLLLDKPIKASPWVCQGLFDNTQHHAHVRC
ncbi:quinon protein alcohol dehydrogenase-like superfamily [Suillus subaureus]|uniref:Quinon protein alcohol dehydrogenase-like superfamily n=1 Tax=Suillus subaureus TaxID=48587 RepID=A0A9P7JEE0_9AGAM|nr:quinon protein alcohol dehydrogenase-like superfamily [Suillus subaureus]KAG1818444.1 quinon protein alcohol dehydrogenase-like superfamily [Suillus subaureus]